GEVGRFEVVVHAAGVLADSAVAKKTAADVATVVGTKLPRALLQKAKPRLLVGIGSRAGRFGNPRPTEYPAANAAPATLAALHIDFPPFEDSAMAKKIPSFKKQEMLENGVTFLSDDEGAAAFIDALENASGEVLVARSLPKADVVQR